MLRSIVERLTGSLSFNRRLPSDLGGTAIRVTPQAGGLRYLFKPMSLIDPPLLDAARRFVQAGAVVWDVGANVGLFAFAAAYQAGSTGLVVAVEPDLDNLQLLTRSIGYRRKGLAEIKLVDSAIAGSAGIRNFHIAARSRSANFLEGYGQIPAGGTASIRRVHTITLDQLGDRFPLPDVLKLDIEGAELEALSCCKFLSEKRPVIICEVSRDANQLKRLFRGLNYDLSDGERSFTPTTEATWMTIAVPKRLSMAAL
jgi:FkbM family methyltransferase